MLIFQSFDGVCYNSTLLQESNKKARRKWYNGSVFISIVVWIFITEPRQ